MCEIQTGYLFAVNEDGTKTLQRCLVAKAQVFIPTRGWVSRYHVEATWKIKAFPKKIEHAEWNEELQGKKGKTWRDAHMYLSDFAWCFGVSGKSKIGI